MRTYGTVKLDKSKTAWQIECEPHVAIRLKRMFGKVDKSQHGKFTIKATAETTRDIEWFLTRYPMEIRDRDKFSALSSEHKERIALVDELLAKQGPGRAFELAIPLRDYQGTAAALALATRGLLIADDVGLGKTASSIAMLTDPATLPALVVTLTHLPTQWRNEIAKFAPHLNVHIIKQGKPYDVAAWGKRKREGQTQIGTFPDVLIINYHKLVSWVETLGPLVNCVIFDECQELRRSGSKGEPSSKYHAAKHIAQSVSFRCGLSATPVYNHGGEIWNVMDCLSPNALGTFQEFTNEWCSRSWDTSDPSKQKINNPAAFGTYMRESGLMIRRTRQEVGRELPGLSIVPYAVDADESALDSVGDSCRELAKIILAQGEGYRGQKMHASEELSNKLRQATGIAKAPYVADFVRLLVEAGEKIVLYAWHREVYSIYQDKLKEFNPVMYTGSESPAQKDAAKKAFVEGDSKVFLISLRAGAGLDGLQNACRTVVFGELDWSPGVHVQCAGRVARDGQTDKVVAYFLISTGGSDPIVSETLGLKKAQSEGLLNEEKELVGQLQSDGGHIRQLAAHYLNAATDAAKENAA